jgi:hypothetical protein
LKFEIASMYVAPQLSVQPPSPAHAFQHALSGSHVGMEAHSASSMQHEPVVQDAQAAEGHTRVPQSALASPPSPPSSASRPASPMLPP